VKIAPNQYLGGRRQEFVHREFDLSLGSVLKQGDFMPIDMTREEVLRSVRTGQMSPESRDEDLSKALPSDERFRGIIERHLDFVVDEIFADGSLLGLHRHQHQ
jgi:hypothetical protein